MDSCMDFVSWLEPDTSIKILMCLEDPSDLVCASCVSRSWRRFVIEHGMCKQLCLKLFPQLSRIDHVVEVKHESRKPEGIGSSRHMEWVGLEKDHRAFMSLAHGCQSAALTNCISEAISASTTDNYPEESVHNTLDHRDRIARMASYWSSTGQKEPAVPETLIYKLCSNLCVIIEINVQPFEAYFQLGRPIYSAQYVRFRMGHPKTLTDIIGGAVTDERCPEPADDKFIWTYTSEAFPMAQESRLQKFKLPEPILCVGGYLQVELMGRVQRQEMDNLFYICVAHVQAIGRPLSPAFDADILEPSGKFVLKYFPQAQLNTHETNLPADNPNGDSSSYLQRRVRDLEHILDLLRGHVVDVEYEWDEDPEEDPEASDEEFVA